MDIIHAFELIIIAHDIVHALLINTKDDLIRILQLRYVRYQLIRIHRKDRTTARSRTDRDTIDIDSILCTIDPKLNSTILRSFKKYDGIAIIYPFSTYSRSVHNNRLRIVFAHLYIDGSFAFTAVLAKVNGNQPNALKSLYRRSSGSGSTGFNTNSA